MAESFFLRLKGLIGYKAFDHGQAILLRPCNDIHMWFMSIPIDVVFLRKVAKTDDFKNNNKYIVTSLKKNLRPWKLLPVRDSNASATLELPVGVIDQSMIKVGDEICIS